MTEVKRLLLQIEQGDPLAAEQLLPLVYGELRRLAARRMAKERPGQTLDATGLVHEVYLRLSGGANPQSWQGRNHFFAAAAEAMRRILIEKARRKNTLKLGRDRVRVDLDVACSLAANSPTTDLLALDEALTRLSAKAPAKAELVKLRYFVGCTMSEAADALGISVATAERHWAYARSWLYAELSDSDAADPPADPPPADGGVPSSDRLRSTNTSCPED
jgi:RNA polymerase sigma factor (TIGR02999 family)